MLEHLTAHSRADSSESGVHVNTVGSLQRKFVHHRSRGFALMGPISVSNFTPHDLCHVVRFIMIDRADSIDCDIQNSSICVSSALYKPIAERVSSSCLLNKRLQELHTNCNITVGSPRQ